MTITIVIIIISIIIIVIITITFIIDYIMTILTILTTTVIRRRPLLRRDAAARVEALSQRLFAALAQRRGRRGAGAARRAGGRGARLPPGLGLLLARRLRPRLGAPRRRAGLQAGRRPSGGAAPAVGHGSAGCTGGPGTLPARRRVPPQGSPLGQSPGRHWPCAALAAAAGPAPAPRRRRGALVGLRPRPPPSAALRGGGVPLQGGVAGEGVRGGGGRLRGGAEGRVPGGVRGPLQLAGRPAPAPDRAADAGGTAKSRAVRGWSGPGPAESARCPCRGLRRAARRLPRQAGGHARGGPAARHRARAGPGPGRHGAGAALGAPARIESDNPPNTSQVRLQSSVESRH